MNHCRLLIATNFAKYPISRELFAAHALLPASSGFSLSPFPSATPCRDFPRGKGTVCGMKDAKTTSAYFFARDEAKRSLHEETVARVAQQLLAGFEGPLWRAIRGKGLSYDFGLLLREDQKLDYFYLSDCTSPAESYEAAWRIVEEYCEKGVSEEEMRGARGGVCFDVCELLDDPAANAACLFAKQRGLSYTRDMLEELRCVEKREVERCIRDVLGRIFEVGRTGFVITCPEERTEDIVEEFSEIGFEVEVKAFDSLLLESFSGFCWESLARERGRWNESDGIVSGMSTAITQEDNRSAE